MVCSAGETSASSPVLSTYSASYPLPLLWADYVPSLNLYVEVLGPQNVTVFRDRAFSDFIEVRSLGWALIQCHWCL